MAGTAILALVVTSACSKIPFNVCAGGVTLTSDPGYLRTAHQLQGNPARVLHHVERGVHEGIYAGYTFSCTAEQGFEFCNGCKGD